MSLPRPLKVRVAPSHLAPSDALSHLAPSAPSHFVTRLLRPTSKWQIPQAPDGASVFVTPGAPDSSAILVRMRSRRPSSQMPPLGTVIHDREAVELVTARIRDLDASGQTAPNYATAAPSGASRP